MSYNGESKGKQILGIFLGLYLFSTQIMTVVFWWRMLKDSGFFRAMFINPFIAEFKGLLWPFFV